MWGVAKDNSLWFRVGTAGRTAEWAGDNWTKVRILSSTLINGSNLNLEQRKSPRKHGFGRLC